MKWPSWRAEPPIRASRDGVARTGEADGGRHPSQTLGRLIRAAKVDFGPPRGYINASGSHEKIAIVPAYNEEKTVGAVLAEIKEACPDFDILVVNDGSTDRTAEVAATVPGARVVSLPLNLGIGGAVQTGFLYARKHGYDVAVQVDADGQHRPAEVRLLLDPILKGEADMVVGSRFMEKGGYRGRAWRRLGIKIFYLTNRLLLGERIDRQHFGLQGV